MLSKSFRAVLPNTISDAEARRLQHWSGSHCAVSVVFREDGAVVWLGMRERPRSKESFLRSVRGTLKNLNIDVSKLRGRWLTLASDDVVAAEAAMHQGPAIAANGRQLCAVHPERIRDNRGIPTIAGDDHKDCADDRVVILHGLGDRVHGGQRILQVSKV